MEREQPAINPFHLHRYNFSSIESIPLVCGLYFLFDSFDVLIYIGKSYNMRQRIRSHYNAKKIGFSLVSYVAIDPMNNSELHSYEDTLIKRYQPLHNVTGIIKKTI